MHKTLGTYPVGTSTTSAAFRVIQEALDDNECVGNESNAEIAARLMEELAIDDHSPYDRILRLREAIRGLQRGLFRAKRKADQSRSIYLENMGLRGRIRASVERIKELEEQLKQKDLEVEMKEPEATPLLRELESQIPQCGLQ